MTDDEPDQLTGHIAGAAQHDGGNLFVHSVHESRLLISCPIQRRYSFAARSSARACVSPTELMMESPSAAPADKALNAGTFSCSWMMDTPTALSVEGPVTAMGSMPYLLRRMSTPPYAATGSLAESTTPVMALRRSSCSRMASTP